MIIKGELFLWLLWPGWGTLKSWISHFLCSVFPHPILLFQFLLFEYDVIGNQITTLVRIPSKMAQTSFRDQREQKDKFYDIFFDSLKWFCMFCFLLCWISWLPLFHMRTLTAFATKQRMSWLDSITDSMDMNLSKLWVIVEDRGAWCAAVHEVTELDTTQWLSNKFY